jgi:septum site-determining protein MinD
MILGVISGKGGTGKTTVAANVGASLAIDFGRRVLLVDCNMESPDLPLLLNLYPPIPSRRKEVEGMTAYAYRPGFDVVPADSLENVRIERLGSILRKAGYHYVILDAPPVGFSDVVGASDSVLVVTTPDLAAASRAIRAADMAERAKVKVTGIIVNRVRRAGYEVSWSEMISASRVPVIGVIPEDRKVAESLMEGIPCVLAHPGSAASIAFKRLAAELCGEEFRMGPIQRLKLRGLRFWRSV